MTEFLKFILLMLGTYVGSVGFTVVLIRLFFPLQTKEQVEAAEEARRVQPKPRRQRRVAFTFASHGHH